MPSPKIKIKCSVCHIELIRYKHTIKKSVDFNGFYVCKKCSLTNRNKSNSKKLWLIRTHKQSGRPEIKTRYGWVFLHRYIVEKYLGRKLSENECVHHCNENKLCNKIWNLEILMHGEHTTHHSKNRRVSKETRLKISMANTGRASRNRSLTYTQAQKIRDFRTRFNTSYNDLSRLFSVSKEVVANIINNRTYLVR